MIFLNLNKSCRSCVTRNTLFSRLRSSMVEHLVSISTKYSFDTLLTLNDRKNIGFPVFPEHHGRYFSTR